MVSRGYAVMLFNLRAQMSFVDITVNTRCSNGVIVTPKHRIWCNNGKTTRKRRYGVIWDDLEVMGCWDQLQSTLTHCGRVTHVCVSNRTVIGSDNGLSLGRRQAIVWINAGLWLIGPLGTNFNEILIKVQTFSFKKMHIKCRLENGGHLVSSSMW